MHGPKSVDQVVGFSLTRRCIIPRTLYSVTLSARNKRQKCHFHFHPNLVQRGKRIKADCSVATWCHHFTFQATIVCDDTQQTPGVVMNTTSHFDGAQWPSLEEATISCDSLIQFRALATLCRHMSPIGRLLAGSNFAAQSAASC